MVNDLREFLAELEKHDQLKMVKGAHWDLEIGTINELMAEQKGPSLLFDEIVDYPPGYRVAANILYQRLPQLLTFGFSDQASDMEVIRDWKNRWAGFHPVPPVTVNTGPIMENVLSATDIDLFKFPVPRWHTLDGGRYIGTGDLIITKDPKEDWINIGTYRVMIQDRDVLSFYVSPGKHAAIMREKYWAKGQDCPVVMVFGPPPLLLGLSVMPLPWGMSEYDMAGYLSGAGIEVVIGEETGLPIPANAEIAIEGFAPPPRLESRPEGPFGEWTGYYASGSRNEPIVKVKKVYHRNQPILVGHPPVKPPVSSFFPIPIHTAAWLWNQLELAGMVGIQGVYVHGPGNRVVAVISILQKHLGHARQVASIAAGLLQGGACTGRYVVMVDEDIDPSNLEEVLWAVSTRTDPETAIHVVPGFLTSPLDPILSPEKREKGEILTAKVLIDACRPYHWIKNFPAINVASPELRSQILSKWSNLFK